jgi:hypothetical protein
MRIQNAVIAAHRRATAYNLGYYVDLFDFCQLLEKGCNDPKIRRACQRTIKAIRTEEFVFRNGFVPNDERPSYGLSVYFPWSPIPQKVVKVYQNFDFAMDTGWLNFLQTFVKVVNDPSR